MPNSSERRFDLNIEKILEGWETCHAVREVIANALDEQVLTGTRDVDISKDLGVFQSEYAQSFEFKFVRPEKLVNRNRRSLSCARKSRAWPEEFRRR
jgi:hypothetical protein